MLIKALALVSTVLLLMSLGFSVLGATPLLILKHKRQMDSRVIRQVFHYCYRLVAVVAIAASVGHALEGRPVLSACTGGIALMASALHHWMLARMDAVPALGQHTRSILAEIGYAPDDIARLESSHAV